MENSNLLLEIFSAYVDDTPDQVELEESWLVKLLEDLGIQDPFKLITSSILSKETFREYIFDPKINSSIVVYKLTRNGVSELNKMFSVGSNELHESADLDDENIINIKANLIVVLNKNRSSFNTNLVTGLIDVLNQKKIDSIKLSIECRKVCEYISDRFVSKSSKLFDNICEMEKMGVPKFIISYFHVLRHLANSLVHRQKDNPAFPIKIDQKDNIIALFALDRVIEFYVNNPK